MSIPKIASQLDRTEVAVRSRIRKLRKRHPERLKQYLKAEFDGEDGYLEAYLYTSSERGSPREEIQKETFR